MSNPRNIAPGDTVKIKLVDLSYAQFEVAHVNDDDHNHIYVRDTTGARWYIAHADPNVEVTKAGPAAGVVIVERPSDSSNEFYWFGPGPAPEFVDVDYGYLSLGDPGERAEWLADIEEKASRLAAAGHDAAAEHLRAAAANVAMEYGDDLPTATYMPDDVIPMVQSETELPAGATIVSVTEEDA
jgi:hypothetical protein